jgi:hypothetical protein
MMDIAPETPLSVQIAAAMDWWRDAGVDCDFADDPRSWLATQEPAPAQIMAANATPKTTKAAPAPAEAAPVPAIGGDKGDWPTDLAGFTTWWLSEASLDGGQTSGRVTPRGPAAAELMVLVSEPEAEDGDRLLSDVQGRLLDAILSAMGISPDAAYIASALPRHTPMADWAGLQAAGLGEIIAHHIKLAAPKRLIVFGGNVLPLLGHDPANSPDGLRIFNHEGVSLPLLGAMELAAMLARPRTKARFWQQWLEWSILK